MYIIFFTVLQLHLASIKKETVNFSRKYQDLIFIKKNVTFIESKEKKFNKKIKKLYSNSTTTPVELKNINIIERKKIFNKKFKEMFKEKTNWSLKTQKQVFELIMEAGIYNDDFFEKVDKIIRIALSKIDLKPNSIKYDKKYYLYFLQASTQIKFFNRNTKNCEERWHTGLQSFITDKNINKVREMISNMDNFNKEINFREDISHDIIVVLGTTLAYIRNRTNFACKEIIKELKRENFKNNKKIVILTSDRVIFNDKQTNKIIKKTNSYEEIKNIFLTNEQKDFIEFYKKNNLNLKKFKKNFEKFTEDTAAKIVIKEINNDIKNYNNITIETLKTKNQKISNNIFNVSYKRANTVDTVKTLFEKYPILNQNIVFVTNQPHIQSQKAQIETYFKKNKKIEIVGEGLKNINNDNIKIILQNIAGVINSNFEMIEEKNREAVRILGMGIEYLKLLEYKKSLNNHNFTF